jgi:hypothetical protein
MPEREELIDLAIEQYMDGLDFEDRESLLRDFLSDEWHSAPFERQERFIEATRARDLWEAEQEQD